MGDLICRVLNIYVIVVFARIILSWFPMQPGGLGAQLFSFTYTVTEPVLGPIRRVMPKTGMFDLSPIIVIIGSQLLCSIVA
jgi:YggT family protein